MFCSRIPSCCCRITKFIMNKIKLFVWGPKMKNHLLTAHWGNLPRYSSAKNTWERKKKYVKLKYLHGHKLSFFFFPANFQNNRKRFCSFRDNWDCRYVGEGPSRWESMFRPSAAPSSRTLGQICVCGVWIEQLQRRKAQFYWEGNERSLLWNHWQQGRRRGLPVRKAQSMGRLLMSVHVCVRVCAADPEVTQPKRQSVIIAAWFGLISSLQSGASF